MKNSLFTRLIALTLTAALLVPYLPVVRAEELTEPAAETVAETTAATETAPATEETQAAETTEAAGPVNPPETTEATQATVPEESIPPETLPEETVPEETLPEETLPEDTTALPEDYAFSPEHAFMRAGMRQNNVLDQLANAVEGQDYVASQILIPASTQEEAQLFAADYEGTLDAFSGNIATVILNGTSVYDAVAAGLEDETLPVASPNYIRQLPIVPARPGDKPGMSTFSIHGDDVPERQDWKSWMEYYGEEFDYLLKDPTNRLYQSDDYEQSGYQYMHDTVDTWAAWGAANGNVQEIALFTDDPMMWWHDDFNDVHGQYELCKDYSDVNNALGIYERGDYGTAMAGIIAASRGNYTGGAGIAPTSNVYEYNAFAYGGDEYGWTTDALADALFEAAENSWKSYDYYSGTASPDEFYYEYVESFTIMVLPDMGPFYDPFIQWFINRAHDRDKVIIAPMGDQGSNVKSYPAAYDHVIAVGATDKTGRRAWFSNYGDWCDVSAPGVDMVVPGPNSCDDYNILSGTDLAAAVVAGVCAVYMEATDVVDPDAVEQALKSGAVKCSDAGMGKGIVNAANMLGGKPEKPGYRIFRLTNAYSNELLFASSDVHNSERYPHLKEYDGSVLPRNTAIGVDAYEENSKLVYTTDGTTPSVKNGKVVNGQLYNDESLSIYPYEHEGSSLTVKAMTVSGLGVPGPVLTLKVNFSQEWDDNDSTMDTGNSDYHLRLNRIISGDAPPAYVVAGKTTQLSAEVGYLLWDSTEDWDGDNILDIHYENQTMYWEIADLYPSPNNDIDSDPFMNSISLDPRTGELTIKKLTAKQCREYGYDSVADFYEDAGLVISVSSKSEGLRQEIEVYLRDVPLVKSIALPRTEITGMVGDVINLDGNLIENLANGTTGYKMVNTKKQDVTLENIGNLVFSSSNPRVAYVTPDGTIHMIREGEATITVTVMDGSKKSAKCTVTVEPEHEPYLSWITAPSRVVAGKSAQFDALVYWNMPDGSTMEAANQDIRWRVIPGDTYSGKAPTIDSKGLLKVPAGSSGPILVLAEHPTIDGLFAYDMKGYDYVTILAEDVPLVKSITLTEKKLTLYTQHVSPSLLEKITDAKGNDVTDKFGSCYLPGSTQVNPDWSIQWSSSNPDVAMVTTSGQVIAQKKGTATITCAATDGSGKSAKCTVTVKQQITGINITGPADIHPGGSATYKAEYLPADANTKKVTWSLVSAPEGVKITTGGKVTVPSDLAIGTTFQVKAAAKDGYLEAIGADATQVPVEATYEVRIQPKVSSITIHALEAPLAAEESKGTLKTLYLFPGRLNSTDFHKAIVSSEITCDGQASEAARVWSSSDPDVVSVSKLNAASCELTAQQAGTAKITVTMQDAGKKSASFTVKVTEPVEALYITGTPILSPGDKSTYKTEAHPTSADNKKVTWSLEAQTDRPDPAEYGITISAKGVVTVPKDAAVPFQFFVKATARDGSLTEGRMLVSLVPKAEKLILMPSVGFPPVSCELNAKTGSLSSLTLFSVPLLDDAGYSADLDHCIINAQAYADDMPLDAPIVEWESSKPDVVSVADGELKARKAGSAKITATMLDTGKESASFTVTVLNPVSWMEIEPDDKYVSHVIMTDAEGNESKVRRLAIGLGKTAKNKAVFGETFGKPSNTKVSWSYQFVTDSSVVEEDEVVIAGVSDNWFVLPDEEALREYITLDQKGNLKVKNDQMVLTLISDLANEYDFRNFYIQVIAEAQDGSGVVATAEYEVVIPSTKVGVYDFHTMPDNDEEAQPVKTYTIAEGRGNADLYVVADQHSLTNRCTHFKVTSSNPDVCAPSLRILTENGFPLPLLFLAGLKQGTAKITVTAMDGSGKSYTFTVKVEEYRPV